MSKLSIKNIYEEGNIDYIFFSEIVGHINHDENDNCYGKSDINIFEQALQFCEFVFNIGHFELGNLQNGGKYFQPYDSFEDFSSSIVSSFQDKGLKSDDLTWVYAISKKFNDQSAPKIPYHIGKLFEK